MKRFFYLFLAIVLLGCEDSMEDIHRYSKIISESKDYPVYLDMSEVGNIQVIASMPQESPFKIVFNNNYYFVGEMLKGVHVYEKSGGAVSYLCFIECKYIKGLEIIGSHLFCNNFVDLVVLDVSNPLQASVLHREENHFNQFTEYKEYWNFPYVEGKGIVVGTQTYVLTGTVTHENPNLDFTEYDQLYGNLTTKELPETWFSSHPENDKPYIGIVKVDADRIYTYGSYNSWAICSFLSGIFNVVEEDLWSAPRGEYAPPYYYSNAHPVRMFFADSMIFILGSGHSSTGYCDCIIYNESYPLSYHLYFSDSKPLDITYVPAMQAFFVLSGHSVWGAFTKSDPTYTVIEKYIDYEVPTDATSIFLEENKVVTIGSKLSVYLPSENELMLVKDYPDISGTCYSKAENILAVANVQGLFLYDINNLENINPIP